MPTDNRYLECHCVVCNLTKFTVPKIPLEERLKRLEEHVAKLDELLTYVVEELNLV